MRSWSRRPLDEMSFPLLAEQASRGGVMVSPASEDLAIVPRMPCFVGGQRSWIDVRAGGDDLFILGSG